MSKFDYQAALKAGKDPQEIDQFVAQHPELTVVNKPDTNPVGNFIRNIPLVGGILSPAISTAEDLGTTLGYNSSGVNQSSDLLLQESQKAADAANKTTDPTEKAKLQQLASQGFQQVGQTSRQMNNSFSPDVSQNPLQRGISTGVAVGGAADLPFALKGTLASLPAVARSLTTKGAGKVIGSTVEAGAKKGITDNLNDALTEFKQSFSGNAEGSFTGYPEKGIAYGKIVKHITGADLSPETIAKLSPRELFAKTKINPKQMQNIINNLSEDFPYSDEPGANLLHRAASEAKNTISARQQEITPGLGRAKAVYSAHKNLQEAYPVLRSYAAKTALGLTGIGLLAKLLQGDQAPTDASQ